MDPQIHRPDGVFEGGRLRSDLAVVVSAGRVREIISVGDLDDGAMQHRIPGIVAPGFVDLQVNGGAGVLLNATPTRATIEKMVAAHRHFGTAAIMPTVITDRAEVMQAAADAVMEARDVDGVIGLHIEGPHIDIDRRGTHQADFIRPFDQETADTIGMLRRADVPVMITVSPRAIACDDIRRLADDGVVVSLGHTAASADEVFAAIAAGARAATHLMNAMPPIVNRDPGAVPAILEAGIPAGLICDGYHVDDILLKLLLRAAKPDGLFLVSDSMPTIGGPDTFALQEFHVALKDGRLVNDEGTLAGAHITQAEAVQRLVCELDVPLETALRMAIHIPATLVNRPDLATLDGRDIEHLILIDENGHSRHFPGVPDERSGASSATGKIKETRLNSVD